MNYGEKKRNEFLSFLFLLGWKEDSSNSKILGEWWVS